MSPELGIGEIVGLAHAHRRPAEHAPEEFTDNICMTPTHAHQPPATTVDRRALLRTFDALLQPERFKDYGPNGLQVEGKQDVRKVVSGVTASRAFIEAAITAQADAIFVHHGLFWRGHDGRVSGWLKQRLALLLAHDISLFAYHLPLDAHPEFGNNAQLGQRLGLLPTQRFGDQELGWLGNAAFASSQALAEHVQTVVGRSIVLVPGKTASIQRVAWCTGGAQNYFEAAINAGADAFVTGEISEPQAHLARETGVAYLACGHHATERYGAPAVGAYVASQFSIEHMFIDIDNPA